MKAMKVIVSIMLLYSILACRENSDAVVVSGDMDLRDPGDSTDHKNDQQDSILTDTIPDVWTDLAESEDYVARHECSFTQIGNRFILFGGREQSRRLELYDYQLDTWSLGSQAPKEFNHFQATSYKGFVWVIGAFKTNNFPREEPEENVWLYQFASDRWIKGPEIPEDRRRGGAGLVV